MKNQVIEIPDGYELKQEGNTYTIVKSEKKLPESWEELCEVKGSWVSPDSSVTSIEKLFVATDDGLHRNVFRTKEQAEASIALAQLTQLVHVWREGWEPDWGNQRTKKYVIEMSCNKIVFYWRYTTNNILSFDTKEKAKEFLSKPKINKLIKTAAPLLWGVTLK